MHACVQSVPGECRHPNLVITGHAVWKGSIHIRLDLAYLDPPPGTHHHRPQQPQKDSLSPAVAHLVSELEPSVLMALLMGRAQTCAVTGDECCRGDMKPETGPADMAITAEVRACMGIC